VCIGKENCDEVIQSWRGCEDFILAGKVEIAPQVGYSTKAPLHSLARLGHTVIPSLLLWHDVELRKE